MQTSELIPALLVESEKEFEEKLRLVENDTDTVQVDILDGSLFDNTTWFDAENVGALRTRVNYELHLMVKNPLPIIRQWVKHVPNLTRAIFHAEMERPVGPVVQKIQDKHGLEAGVAVNPETPLSEIESVFHTIDTVLIMGVDPGFSGQEFQGKMIYEKIRRAHKHRPDLPIAVDGGVHEEVLEPLITAGASRLCSASMIFGADDPTAKLRELKEHISTHAQDA